jgi:hypothetical protein
MEKELQLLNDYKNAMNELIQIGTVKTTLVQVPNGTFTRVSITVNNIKYKAENIDLMLATIQLRNQI